MKQRKFSFGINTINRIISARFTTRDDKDTLEKDEFFEKIYKKELGLKSDQVIVDYDIDEDRYVLVLRKPYKKIDFKCPKCMSGDLYLPEISCQNPEDEEDKFGLQIVRCSNIDCDFIAVADASSSIKQWANKITQQGQQKSELVEQQHEQRKQEFEKLKELAKKAEWKDLFFAIYDKSRVGALGILIIVGVFLLGFVGLAIGVQQKISASISDGVNINIEQSRSDLLDKGNKNDCVCPEQSENLSNNQNNYIDSQDQFRY